MPVNSAAQSAGLILSNARGEIGFHEGANNANKYAGYAGHANNQAWCSTFVTWALKKAEAQGAKIPDFVKNAEPRGAAVESYKAAYEKAGQTFRKGTPQPGDLVFFGANGGSHIGIVEKVENGKVYTIEGNTSDQVARRSYSLNDPYINSFGRTFGDKIPSDARLGGGADGANAKDGGGGKGGAAHAGGGKGTGGAAAPAGGNGGAHAAGNHKGGKHAGGKHADGMQAKADRQADGFQGKGAKSPVQLQPNNPMTQAMPQLMEVIQQLLQLVQQLAQLMQTA